MQGKRITAVAAGVAIAATLAACNATGGSGRVQLDAFTAGAAVALVVAEGVTAKLAGEAVEEVGAGRGVRPSTFIKAAQERSRSPLAEAMKEAGRADLAAVFHEGGAFALVRHVNTESRGA